MKKRTLAILMILVLATAGLFAGTFPTAGNGATSLSATLNATIGEYLFHGFNVSGVKYQSSVSVSDAFTTNPVITYGYKTNAVGTYTFQFSISDFIHSAGSATGVVKIASVSSSVAGMAWNTTDSMYDLFSTTSAIVSEDRNNETNITIVPAKSGVTTDHRNQPVTAVQVAGDGTSGSSAPAGSYTSTLTFAIKST